MIYIVVFIWIVIISLFILSFVGIVYPIIPSLLFIWGGFILYYFMIDQDSISVIFWIVMSLFSIFLIGADLIMNAYFVKRFGGSKWGERGAGVAIIVGSFIAPPFGILIVPFITVFLIELLQKRTIVKSLWASVGSLIGFLSGSFAKIVMQFIMIIWFLVTVLF